MSKFNRSRSYLIRPNWNRYSLYISIAKISNMSNDLNLIRYVLDGLDHKMLCLFEIEQYEVYLFELDLIK